MLASLKFLHATASPNVESAGNGTLISSIKMEPIIVAGMQAVIAACMHLTNFRLVNFAMAGTSFSLAHFILLFSDILTSSFILS